MKYLKSTLAALSFCLSAFSFTLSAQTTNYPQMVLVQGGSFTMGDAEDEGSASV